MVARPCEPVRDRTHMKTTASCPKDRLFSVTERAPRNSARDAAIEPRALRRLHHAVAQQGRQRAREEASHNLAGLGRRLFLIGDRRAVFVDPNAPALQLVANG